jgi:peroxiredoxin
VIAVGEAVPDVRLWLTPRDTLGLRELADEAPCLLLFYLYDWSST